MAVQIKIVKSPWGYTKITAEGHAPSPTVCAGVSTVMWGLAGALLNLKSKPNINTMVMNSGNFDIDISPLEGLDQIPVDTCFMFATVALGQLARNNPNEITIG